MLGWPVYTIPQQFFQFFFLFIPFVQQFQSLPRSCLDVPLIRKPNRGCQQSCLDAIGNSAPSIGTVMRFAARGACGHSWQLHPQFPRR